jgi:hypothetical protein
MTEAPTKNKKPAPSPCKCPDQHDPYCCCGLECFERPNYFCGHLLTDADLLLDQKYIIEKNKLRNRALHGYGVVCGLRIWCDPDCCGSIRIGEGYAIDNCGNDLVVCKEISFPFLEEARKCGYVDPPQPRKEHRREQAREMECDVKECFYIAICYEEELAEYTTPYKSGCDGGPSACEPTRIREKVYVKVLKELPKHTDFLKELEERIEHCYRILTEGPFSDILKVQADAYATGKLPEGHQGAEESAHYDNFCRLVVYFKKWLRCHPSPSSCDLEDRVMRIECPRSYKDDREGTIEAYRRLLDEVHEYVYGCIRNELVFPCKATDCASCVVLGTVEVTNGCITHVCNTHRHYVWSFANFFEVLLYELLENNQESKGRKSCCPERPIDLDFFLKLFHHDRWGGQKSAQSLMAAARQVRGSLRQAFDFTEERVMSPNVLLRKPIEEALDIGKTLGMNVTRVDAANFSSALDPVTASLPHFLKTSGLPDRIYAVVDEKGQVIAAVPGFTAPAADFTGSTSQTGDVQKRLDEMAAEIAALRAQLPKQGEQHEEPK